MWFLFGEVSSSSWCLGWATLFYCGFHIIIFQAFRSLISRFNSPKRRETCYLPGEQGKTYNFGKQKQHKMKELSTCGFEKECIRPESHYRKLSTFCTGFYVNPKFFEHFLNKQYLNNSAVTL